MYGGWGEDCLWCIKIIKPESISTSATLFKQSSVIMSQLSEEKHPMFEILSGNHSMCINDQQTHCHLINKLN